PALRTSCSGWSVISMPEPTTRRAFATSRTATPTISMPRPARRLISSWLRRSVSKVPRPTVPSPSKPTFIGFIRASPVRTGQPRRLASGSPGHQRVAPEHVAYPAHRLSDSVLVLDQGEAHVRVAIVAETDSGRDGNLGLGEQLLGKLEGPARTISRRDFGPDVHRGLRRLHRPAGLLQAFDQNVA